MKNILKLHQPVLDLLIEELLNYEEIWFLQQVLKFIKEVKYYKKIIKKKGVEDISHWLGIVRPKLKCNHDKIVGMQTLSLRNLLVSHKKSLPNSICQMTNLSEINIGDNKLKSLPEGLFDLKKLSCLNLENNEIESLEPICKLTNLQHLFVSNNKLKNLPNSINKLTKLFKLELNNNEITELPDFDLPNLEELDLRRNKLTKLNSSMLLPKLDTFHIEYNQITELKNLKFPNLLRFNFLNNDIKEISNLYIPKIEYMNGKFVLND